ncbi:MAG: FAD/NAD(P)-binding protein [Desulfuromonadaceae bacterium]|nr:FAD/NAD(P)-binding protein [Desulfuromonadaceae bacterium]MDD2854529.1 FAD/NAD(P)-binding protein [Desulfuromonadaceae bacterium]
MNNIQPLRGEISIITRMTADTTLFTLSTKPEYEVASSFLPGQFLELSLPGVGEIPVSYCGFPSNNGTIELCIRHIGHVTNAIKSSAKGDYVGLRGPFGRGFPIDTYGGMDMLLVAGGLGIAPIRSLLLNLLFVRKRYGRIRVVYAARASRLLLFLDELLDFKKNGIIELLLAVDSLAVGEKKNPDCRIALLPALFEEMKIEPEKTFTAVCGPSVVYPRIITSLQNLGVSDDRIHISLERRMKCGIGRCGHCAIGEYLCCLDGPVFSVAELSGVEGGIA